MKVVFVSAPYSSCGSVFHREDVTRVVEATAMLLWENGIAAVAPHLNTGRFSDHRPVDLKTYRNGYVELVRRCDAVLVLFPTRKAPGQQEELEVVKAEGKPTFKDVKAVLKWAKG